ncbi:MAG: tetratricopeptide repeat protein [Bacteroidetes bacterium]|nr:tetratricopeptide repeat protein [Bacteroidota bacterium]
MKNIFFLFVFSLLVYSCGNDSGKTTNDSLKPNDSVSLINEQIRKDPANLDLYVKRSRLEMNRKQFGPALDDMNRVIAVDSNKAEYLIAAADINFFTMHTLRADSLLSRAVRLHPDNVDCLLKLATMDHYLTKYDDELKLLDAALHVDVHNSQVYYMKGMMFKERHDTMKAISSFQTAVEQDPDHYNAFMQLGLLFSTKKDPLAEQYFMNAISLNPNSEEAIYALALFYQQEENWNRAIETYTTLLKINPHHFDAHYNLGIIDVVNLKMTDDGMKYFNLAIEDNPKEPRGYYGRGYCYEVKGDVTNAEADYRMALKQDPNYDKATFALNKLLGQ